jgi:uncharacterized membrane protein
LKAYLFLRLLHISSAIIFVGGLFARQAVRSLMSRASDLTAFSALNLAAGRVERLMVIPGNLLAIVSGVLLALLTRAPILGSALGPYRNWLLVSIIILALLFPSFPWYSFPADEFSKLRCATPRPAGSSLPNSGARRPIRLSAGPTWRRWSGWL